MALTVATIQSEEPVWGRANPRRGAGFEDAAIAFVHEFPIGGTLTAEQFDEWAMQVGLLKPPASRAKQSDAWQAHLQRRHQLKYGINKASAHPRMNTPFIIETVGSGVWEVRSPHFAISRSTMLDRIESLIKTRRQQLAYLMQSADWAILPPHERTVAESLYDDIEMLKQRMELESQGLANKFAKLERKLRKAVERGDIKPANGGIRAIIDDRDLDDTVSN